jgi:hypothetical protein
MRSGDDVSDDGRGHDEAYWLVCQRAPEIQEDVKQARRRDVLVLLRHVPTAVGALLDARFDLDRTQSVADVVSQNNVAVGDADRR